MTEESAVKVCVRVRPLVAREERAGSEKAEPVQLFWKADEKSVHQIDDGNPSKSFSFDRVFNAKETTNQLYQAIAKPIVVSTVEGYNGTIFAYGQTSSGKTFTMMGSEHNPGVMPLALEDVFQTIKKFPKKEFLLRVSYMEIYNETVTDLLVDSWKRKPLEVREMMNKNIYVADLTEELVTSLPQALAWIRKGEKNRHYGKTKMNERSSRSHAIFRMILESRERSDPESGDNADGAIIVSNLNLVDLAGSERASQTGAEGARLKEGCNINRSLFTLGQVIKKLTDEGQKGFTNYRDSKLTRILQNSLGGNAKTLIICTITPVTLDETLSTLQFASTAKKMKNDPQVTEVSDDGALLKRYRNEIEDLKRRLNEVSSSTQTTVTEKEVLSQLLQEKGQLQREQEDRIRNLTKLLVTSSNQVAVPKMPKRRVTWGGKMQRLAHPSACDDGMSDLSLVESFRKRTAYSSCLMGLAEDDEMFDSQWGTSDELSDEMEISGSSVAVRSFGDRIFSPHDLMCEDSEKVSNLELLEIERQQKEEAMKKLATLDGKVVELLDQLQTEAKQKQEALEKTQITELRLAELEVHLQTEDRQKLEALETLQITEKRVAELEMQLQTEDQQKLKALETLQITEKRVAELEMQLQTEDQQKLDAVDKLQITEKRVAEMEMQLQTEDQQKLEALETLQITEKRVAELEMQLQTEDRQKLEALETLQITEKRVAELEMHLQTEAQQKLDAVDKLQITEKRVAEMEMQLQTETQHKLERALEEQRRIETEQMRKEFAETIQLCETLASEKDTVVVERDYLKQELGMFIEQTAKLEQEKAALSQELKERRDLDEFKSLEEEFRKEHELESYKVLQSELSCLKEAFGSSERYSLELKNNLETLSEELKKKTEYAEELQKMCSKDLVQEVATLHCSLDDAEEVTGDAEKELAVNRCQNIALEEHIPRPSQDFPCLQHEEKAPQITSDGGYSNEVENLFSTVASLTAERDQLKLDLQENVDMMIENQEELRTALEKNREQLKKIKVLESAQLSKLDGPPNDSSSQLKELKTNIQTLTEELESVRAERDGLLLEKMASAESSTMEEEDLQHRVMSLSEERDQLQKMLEGLRQEKKQPSADMEDGMKTQQPEMRTLTEKVDFTETWGNIMVAEEEANTLPSQEMEEKEKLLSRVKSLCGEKDQLEEMLETSRVANQQLREEIEKRMEMIEQLEVALQDGTKQKSQLEGDLQHSREMATDAQNLLYSLQEQLHQQNQRQEEQAELEQQLAEAKSLIQSLQEDLSEQSQTKSDLMKLYEQKESDFEQQIRILSEELANAQAAKHALLHRVTSLTEERDQLQERLNAFREEKQLLRTELEERMEKIQQLENDLEKANEELIKNQKELEMFQEKSKVLQEEITVLSSQKAELESTQGRVKDAESTIQLQKLDEQRLREELESLHAERDSLLSERTSLKEEMEKLLRNDMSVSEEKNLLKGIPEDLTQEKEQFKALLENKLEVVSSTEESLNVQEKLCEQRIMKSDVEKSRQEAECSVDQKIRDLVKELKSVQQERNSLLSEKETNCWNHTEETEKLQCRVTTLNGEKVQLQDMLEGLRRENIQLRAELEGRVETVQTEMRTLTEKLEKQLCKVTCLCEERGQLQEALDGLKREKQKLRAELEERKKLHNEASATISGLKEQLKSLELRTKGVKETASLRLQHSAGRLQSLLHLWAVGYRKLFEELVNKELSILEEQWLQDMLQAQRSKDVKDDPFHTLWEHRQKELLEKWQLNLEKMDSILEKLLVNVASYLTELEVEILEREKFEEELQSIITNQSTDFSRFDGILKQELDRRSVVPQSKKMLLQLMDEQNCLFEDTKQLDTQADSQLRRERSKSFTLLQALKGDPSVVKDNQHLVFQLQQSEENIKALHIRIERMEEAQTQANKRLSSHKEATQLLQTELLDSRALVNEKERTIQTLNSKLRESEKKTSPISLELENLQNKLLEMELKLTSVSDDHQKEMQTMATLLREKEQSLRKLKEALRKSQQEGEDSILQGEDLYSRLANPKSMMIKSSIQLEKNKLEEEVKQLQLKIAELESLAFSQQAEISKWKNRAINIRMKSKAAVDKPSSPCTPTKRGRPMTPETSNLLSSPKKFLVTPKKIIDSPKKVLESPVKQLKPLKVSLLDSPKSRFFDACGSSELLSRTCPKQFFDNSGLGTIPEAAVGPDRDDEIFPHSPKQEEMCKTQ
ncbi:centromere-associated protein E [Odontesthes bonariensis]|uniref:centromere-associated protein E n=1 Tax=Odontesthes bonariensis TaxID=219752 RepID=UPI003F58DF9D